MSNLESQLTSLQHTVRRQQIAIFSLAVALFALVLTSAMPQEARSHKLRKLEILEARDQPRIVLEASEQDRPQIIVSARAGEPLLTLGATDLEQGAIDLFNRDASRVVSLGATEEGHGGVRVDSRTVTPAWYMGRDLRGNGQVPSNVNPGLRVR